MRREIAVTVVLLCGAWWATGEERGFRKAYFGATKPGTFALQRATDEKGAVTEYRYARLADVGGEPVVEQRYEVVSGQFKGSKSVTGCLLPATFPLDKDAIDFQAHAKRCVANAGEGKPNEYPPATMKAIADGMTNYAAIVTFKGTETVGGKPADRYGYEYKSNYINAPATNTGDLWLSDAVPFGLVKDVLTIKDASGKTLSRIETVLAQSGDGAVTALPGWSWAPAAAKAKPAAKSGTATKRKPAAPAKPH